MFNRAIIHELEQWKERRDRKPLMMLGARQVGKTSVLKKFGKDSFEHCAYFSLDEEEGVCDIFRKTKNPLQIIERCRILHPSQSCLKRLCLSLMRYRIVRKPLVP